MDNKFEHEKTISYGCKTGMHDFTNSKSRVVPSGNLTKLLVNCNICKQEIAIEANLNINDLMPNPNSAPPAITPDRQERPSIPETSDGFWDEIRGRNK